MDHLIPDEVTETQLIMLGIIFFSWGSFAIIDAWFLHRKSLDWFAAGVGPRPRPLWGLEWSLGWTFVTFVSWLCFYLGREAALDPGPIPMWAHVWVTIGWAFGISAYYSWARGKAIASERTP